MHGLAVYKKGLLSSFLCPFLSIIITTTLNQIYQLQDLRSSTDHYSKKKHLFSSTFLKAHILSSPAKKNQNQTVTTTSPNRLQAPIHNITTTMSTSATASNASRLSIFSRRSSMAKNSDNKLFSSASSMMSTSSISSIAALKVALHRQKENSSELSKKTTRKQTTCISPTTTEAARASYFAHRA
ncbi:hypothetical protein H100_05938 [Trichophyton rubrum MR850]|nr:hypothetical protein H100_05938 [Trichophyton rubrum MR850]